MATQLSPKRASEFPEIPDRLYFKIGDVARISGLETYVLRFWESQFPQLKPNKSGTGQRLYRRREVELVLEIKRLVHGEGYTLSGARHALDSQNRKAVPQESRAARQSHQEEDAAAGSVQRLAAASTESSQHKDALAATIGRARAELREIVELLTVQAQPQLPRPLRRRPRFATIPNPSNSLFPS